MQRKTESQRNGAKVVERREKKYNSEKKREETNYKKNKGTEKNVARKKPLKTSAVIITAKNNQ